MGPRALIRENNPKAVLGWRPPDESDAFYFPIQISVNIESSECCIHAFRIRNLQPGQLCGILDEDNEDFNMVCTLLFEFKRCP